MMCVAGGVRMPRSYQVPGLTISVQAPGAPDRSIRDLQSDLRALGYLNSNIDGVFGRNTAKAIQALQFDLLFNDGSSSSHDGRAPIAIRDYAKGRVVASTGDLDQSLAACIDEMMSDGDVPKLPAADDPIAQNQTAIAAISAIAGAPAPIPFLLAMFVQESDSHHFSVPTQSDSDNFVIVGLDRNDHSKPEHITSRGYGLGQFTLFHHPPRLEEIDTFIRDPVANVRAAIAEFRAKFDALAGKGCAFDRNAEHPNLPLRLCRYSPTDRRYLSDCVQCARTAGRSAISRGTPLFEGSQQSYQPSQYYSSADYGAVPDRSDFLCDWPYAARRYNGSGLNSFHYQTRILRNLERLVPRAAGAGS